jgi:DNA-binding NarL/FixJ family response regulator
MDLNSVIGDIYDAGADERDWLSVGRTLFKYLGANAGSLRFRRADGQSVNLFEISEAGEARYTDYYRHIDPIRSALTRIAPLHGSSSAVLVVEDLVDAAHYRRSEFYQDFAKPNGQEHMLLGVVGDHDHTVIGFFREGMAFGAEERSMLSLLLPHVKRALQLHQRLHRAELDARLGYAAFEALPGSAIVVDGDCNVLFANSLAKRCFSRRGLPIAMSASISGGNTRLIVDNRGKAACLRAMISDAANGGSGGAMRLELDAARSDHIDQLAVFVSPQPPQFSAGESIVAQGAPVLILVHELSRASIARPSLLGELFGLSAAESAVAMALLGGQTAETVAHDRDVSLETVRTQIRTVLRKTDAANLRDFERIGALLATLSH